MDVEGRTAGSASAGEAGPSLIQRVFMVFTAPGKLGEVLRGYSPWFWTIAIVAIISAIAFVLLPTELFEQAIQEQARARGQEGPDTETMLTMARVGGAVGALVVTFVAALIIAGVLYLVFNVVIGQDALYKQHLSAVAHIYWINTLGFLLLIPIWLSRGDMRITLGFGLLLPDVPTSFGGHLLNSITIFGLWSATALGLIEAGMSGGRISTGKAVGTVLVLYFIWVVISALRAMLLGG